MKDDGVQKMIDNISKSLIMEQRTKALVIALVGKEMSEHWWNNHNKAFNMTPSEQWLQDPHKVYEYMMHHANLDDYSA
jgi:hypothetical protein